jgi:hypothetical protein
MDGKVESLMSSVALSMTIVPNFRVDCYVSEKTFDGLTRQLIEFFSEDDSLPGISHLNRIQLVLDNGAEINRMINRSSRGRKPTLVIMDEEDADAEAYLSGAPVVSLESEDLRFV